MDILYNSKNRIRDLTRLDARYTSKCRMCGKQSIIHDFTSGEIYCKSCGIIIEQKTSDQSHDVSYDYANDNRRTGMPTSISIHDFGLSTVIGHVNKDVKGNRISPETITTIRRIRVQDRRSQLQKSTDANFRIAFEMLQRIQDKICVSDSVKELAAYIYRKAIEQKITQGRSINAVVAASMYAACRNTQTLRTLRDISEVIDIKRKTISQSYRAIVKQLDIKIPVVNQMNYILKIANNLKLPEKTKQLALKILQKATDIGIVAGRDPVGISAAAIYFACIIRQESFTQTQISKASGITVVTIRNRFYEIQKKINREDLPEIVTSKKQNRIIRQRTTQSQDACL